MPSATATAKAADEPPRKSRRPGMKFALMRLRSLSLSVSARLEALGQCVLTCRYSTPSASEPVTADRQRACPAVVRRLHPRTTSGVTVGSVSGCQPGSAGRPASQALVTVWALCGKSWATPEGEILGRAGVQVVLPRSAPSNL